MVGITHVAVGFSTGLLDDLDALLPPASVLVLEEPDVTRAREVGRRIPEHPCVGALLSAPTQDEPRAERLAASVPRPPGVRAVLPSVEYGVVGAAALAQAWGLPGAGPDAARTLRDKARLRTAAAAAELDQPDWRIVTSARQVDEFRTRHEGRCVLKPANRQASLGVRLLEAADDALEAWEHTTRADEPKMRARYAVPARYLVEQRLDGPEVSVEALVQNSEVGVTNVTAKDVQHGASPVELGHVVPASLAPGIVAALSRGVRQLALATGYRDGVLHSEWILVGGDRPHLVECAARLPGDSIDRLIDLAYGGRLTADYIAVLEGRGLPAARVPRRAAAIRFLAATPGTVREIAGTECAAAAPGVEEVNVSIAAGAVIAPVACSWDRLGYIVATGADGRQAAARVADAASMITIDTRAAWA